MDVAGAGVSSPERQTTLLDRVNALAEVAWREGRAVTRLVLGSRTSLQLAEELARRRWPWPSEIPMTAEDVATEKRWDEEDARVRKQILDGRGEGGLATVAGVVRLFVDFEADRDLVELR